MKRKIAILAAVLAAVLMSSCSRYETVWGDPMETKIHTLDNGLQLYMSVNREAPRIQTYIAVKVGGKNDPAATTGLAHYFEHLMFKGSEHFGTSDYAAEKPMLDQIEELFETYRVTTDPAERTRIYARIDSVSYEASKIAIPNEYDKLMAMIGADGTNAWTSPDETVYVEDIPSNQIDNWAKIQADRFRHGVIRGFHTELETIYEEKNMSLTDDGDKVWEAIAQALFPNHPYGRQTVLGTQEHLKNPSITNVKKYHDTFYVPNNIRICVSGDFDPDEMVASVERYFGDWEPNPEIPALEYTPEEPICEPVEKTVYGLESESIALAWRLPAAADLRNSSLAEIASAILYNGQAGLIDLDVNQQQKALAMYGFHYAQADYGSFIVMADPKHGQSLDELKAMALEEVAKLRSGDFDESLITSTINNIKLGNMHQLESNSSRAHAFVNAFINGISWKDECRRMKRMSRITKADVVAWAEEFLGPENYAVVYKRQGEDKTVSKIAAPAITPIVTNRDMQSDFLKEIRETPVKPIEPVFVDFAKEMSVLEVAQGVEMLYKYNPVNDIFHLEYSVNRGLEQDPALSMALDYISYLGTSTRTAEQIASRMYALACDYNMNCGANNTVISISGLSENMAAAIEVVEDLLLNAEGDDEILANVKADIIKSRENARQSQGACFGALRRYAVYGGDFVKATTLKNREIRAITSDELLGKVRSLLDCGHDVLYYGPLSNQAVKSLLSKCHHMAAGAEKLPFRLTVAKPVDAPSVVLSQYDAKQIYYVQYANRGRSFDPSAEAAITLYNEYFGGGMNSVVFQEMREARGLAYSAWARLGKPQSLDDSYSYSAFIATQNDKMKVAVEAFDDIINNMPRSEAAFAIAKEALESRMRTDRKNGMGVLRSYQACRRLGLSEPMDKVVFNAVGRLTLDDVADIQRSWVKDLPYTYIILGDIKDLDMKFLETLGPVSVVSSGEIFGY